ncbi:MAG: response regulator [bacterium]
MHADRLDDFNWNQSVPHILVVDDDFSVRKFLGKVLQKEGYTVSTAENGGEGFHKALTLNPDLIILDVMMPDMDGFEVCTKLQSDEKTKNIPVIFLTVRNEHEDKLRGLNLGAVDYLGKPVNIREMLARVNTQIRLHTLYKRNLAYEQALIETENLNCNRIFIKGVAHNFNNLLTVAVGYIKFMQERSNFSEKDMEYLHRVDTSLERIQALIHQMFYLTEVFASDVKRFDVEKILNDFLFAARLHWPNMVITVNNRLYPKTELLCDQAQIIKALTLLIQNSYEVAGKKCAAIIEVYESDEDLGNGYFLNKTKSICIAIKDFGPGFTETALKYATHPFFSTKNTVGVGLGLSIVQKVVRDYGGKLSIANDPKGGAVVTMAFPVNATKIEQLVKTEVMEPY